MNIGPILFQVATGDITKEVTDVIVNSTSNTFTLKSGTSVRWILSQAAISVVDPMKKCFYRQNGFVNLGLFMLINVFKVISMGFLTTGNIFEIFFSVSNAWAWDCSMMGVLGCEGCLSDQVTHLIFSCRSFQSNFGRCRTKCGERMFCPG